MARGDGVSRIVEYEPAARTYALPPEHRAFLTGKGGSRNLATLAAMFPLLRRIVPDVLEAFRRRRGRRRELASGGTGRGAGTQKRALDFLRSNDELLSMSVLKLVDPAGKRVIGRTRCLSAGKVGSVAELLADGGKRFKQSVRSLGREALNRCLGFLWILTSDLGDSALVGGSEGCGAHPR